MLVNIGVSRILQWSGQQGVDPDSFQRGVKPGGLGDGSLLVGSRGKALVEGLGDEFPQKLKQNVKLVYNF